MCGRYTLKSRAAEISETFGIQAPPTLPERFNIAPTHLCMGARIPLILVPDLSDVGTVVKVTCPP